MKDLKLGLPALRGIIPVALNVLQPDFFEVNPDNPVGPNESLKLPILAHSVKFSLFDPDFDVNLWIKDCQKNLGSLRPEYFSLHYGANFAVKKKLWTFLPIWPNSTQMQKALDRIRALQDFIQCPVGIENLALSLSIEDVKRQTDFLHEICENSNCGILLDLHNTYCQSINFNLPHMELLRSYPMDKVQELHISGGSLFRTQHNQMLFRRDTHDGAVPKDIFTILPEVLGLTKAHFIVLEYLPESLPKIFFNVLVDFMKLKAIKASDIKSPDPFQRTPLPASYENLDDLYELIQTSSALPVSEKFDPRALEVVSILMKKWEKPSE